MTSPKFALYEIVRVRRENPELTEIHGERGVILGITDLEHGPIEYGVFIHRDEMLWQVSEEDLEATGQYSSREELYGNTVVRVAVDEQGRGTIVDVDDPKKASNVVAVTLGFVAALYLAWTGAWLLLPILESGLGWPVTSNGQFLYWTIMKALLWVAPAVLVFRYAGIPVGKAMRGDGIRPVLVWGLGAGLLISVEAVVRKLLGNQPFSLMLDWTLVNVVLIAPLVEEFVFRGAVMGGLMKRYRFSVANAVSSLLFVGAHVPGWYFSGVLMDRLTQPIGGAFSIFVLGLIFGLVVWKSRSVAAGMIAHAINNFLSVL